jgi:glycosyltransferase involved in cell wall biosynthesis/SAM-dependent methyltransferase
MLHNETDLVDVIRTSPLFDAEWYVAQYPDVLAAAADPARHYLLEGGFQQRDPGPAFSSEYYLRSNPDVRRAAFNPLLHYILHGAGARRSSTTAHLGWIAQSEMLDDVDRVAIRQHIAGLMRHPVISVVVPVYNPDPHHLAEMIGSVTRQAYPYWELCIADDSSDDPNVSRILRDAAAVDRRIKLAFRAENGHICAATNTAIGLATGEFICLVDHDDLLHENALYEIAVELDAHPDADIIYSDSDHVDDDGSRYRPYFKTDWNYDLMLGHNMISHLGAYRRSIVETVGGLRAGYEGSQDYDLALRVADASTPSRIRHIPAVLYHWRRPVAAESFSDRAQAECVALARKAITDHLARRGIAAHVEPAPKAPHFSRVVYALPAPRPLVTVALLLSEGDGVVEQIGGILLGTAYEPLELLVIACGPTVPETDAVLRRAANDPRVRVVRLDGSPSRMRAKNRAVDDARGDVVVLLDGDLRPSDPEWLTAMVSHAMRPGIGLVGSPVVGADGTIIDAGIVLNRPAPHAPVNGRYEAYFSILALTREVSAVASACVAFRRSVYLDAGGMSEEGSLQQAEVDLCRRARSAGYRTIATPDAELRRTSSGSVGDGACEVDASEDPFYNPNLSLEQLFEEASCPSRRVKPWAAVRRRLATREGQARRARVLLDGVPRSARILEVGPSYSPIAPKADGWKTTIVDHTTRTNLVEKYRHERDVWVDRIEDVDFIWSQGSIADAVPAALHGTFDVFVASHVIEHVPDVIAFLRSTAALLRDDGTVILAVPDKRFCFDYFRPLATTAHVLEAHQSGRTRHTRRTAFEQYAYSVNNDGTGAWGQEPVAKMTFALGFDTAVDLLAGFDADPEGAYVDMHAWQFTPSSFQLILLELARMRHLDWAVEDITPATGCEFCVRLRRGGIEKAWAMSEDELGARRLALLRGTLCEIGEQVRFAAADFQGTVAT